MTAADCFIALLDVPTPEMADISAGLDRDEGYSLESVRAGRDWKECVLGMYCALFFRLLFHPRRRMY